jgi:hypothetical protein
MQGGRDEKTSFILAYEKRAPTAVAEIGSRRMLFLSRFHQFAKG